MARPILAFTLSQSVYDWLKEKQKNSAVNISGFVSRLLEEVMIKEMEDKFENTERIPD
jgi:hypothetical protein